MSHSIAVRRPRWPKAVLAGALSASFACAAWAQSPQSSLRLVAQTPIASASPVVSPQELQDIAVDAYLYAYPMVLMEATRRAATHVENPIAGRAPMNAFGHRDAFPRPDGTDVAWPSADMLYSSLWYDVASQPLLIDVPSSGDRYYALSLLDMWSDEFASRGSRVSGNAAQKFLLVGPNWHGTAPVGVDVVRSPTGTGWLIARIQTGGPAEYAAVNQFQAGLSASPWVSSPTGMSPRSAASSSLKPSSVTFRPGASPAEQVAMLSPEEFFSLFSELLQANPPHANDNAIVTRMQRIGLAGPQAVPYSGLDPAVRQALDEARPLAGRRIADAVNRLGEDTNGWKIVLSGIGSYGTDYPRRAAVAYAGLGATSPEEALYPVTAIDDQGEWLEGGEDYVLHFDKGQLPPVNASWSLTVYNDKNELVPNRGDRYTLRSTDPLKYNADGSLDIYLSSDEPSSDTLANWLPTPEKGKFTANMRLYWPKDSALDGAWAPPPIRQD